MEKDTTHTFDNYWPNYLVLVRFRNGWGHYPCTDWHWEVKRQLGETNLPNSYVKYYVDKLTGLTWDALVMDAVVLILGVLAFTLSCWLNLQDYNSHRYARHYDSSWK